MGLPADLSFLMERDRNRGGSSTVPEGQSEVMGGGNRRWQRRDSDLSQSSSHSSDLKVMGWDTADWDRIVSRAVADNFPSKARMGFMISLINNKQNVSSLLDCFSIEL